MHVARARALRIALFLFRHGKWHHKGNTLAAAQSPCHTGLSKANFGPNILDFFHACRGACALRPALSLSAGMANGTIRRGSPSAAAQPSCHQSLSKAAAGSP